MGGEELKISSVEKPFDESSGQVKQRELWNLGNVLFFTMADITAGL